MSGGAGNDTVNGDNNDDQVDGGPGNDSVIGEGGDDIIRGGTGADDLVGGAGIDVVDYRGQSLLPLNGPTFDNVANDGGPNEGDNAHSDIEEILSDPGAYSAEVYGGTLLVTDHWGSVNWYEISETTPGTYLLVDSYGAASPIDSRTRVQFYGSPLGLV